MSITITVGSLYTIFIKQKMDSKKSIYKCYMPMAVMFTTVLLISNVMSSAKIIDFGFSIFDIQMILDGGTILFPLSYIFGDILTEIYGYKGSRPIIWIGFISMLLMSVCFKIIGAMQGDVMWEQYAGQASYEAILGSVSNAGILIASALAYLLGEFTNSYVLVKIKQQTGEELLWIRTIGSTLAAQVVDTVTFILIAYIYGVFPLELVYPLIVSNYIYKVGIEIVFTPVTYFITNTVKNIDGHITDGYENNFNPFTL